MLLLVVAMILAGFWQLDRRQEKRDRNALITERQDEPVAPVEEIVAVDDTSVGADVLYRQATATGTYDQAAQVLVLNPATTRPLGSWVLTPLVLEDGSVLVVNLGLGPGDRGGALARRPRHLMAPSR